MILLSPFLVPYYKNKQMDAVAEKLWKEYGTELAILYIRPQNQNLQNMAYSVKEKEPYS